MVRDQELNRLIRYAQGMGVSVRFKPYVRGSNTAAEFTTDGSEITVYTTKNISKIEKVISLIHEIAHMKAFINNERQMDPKVEEALSSEEDKKIYRKRIMNMEVNDSKYWEQIYKDTNCRFGLRKLEMQREFDIWQYEVYYETGEFPKTKSSNKKLKELKTKYKRRT